MTETVCAPAYSSVPERAGSYLKAVEGVAAKIGRTLDPTQRHAVDILTSAKADGSPATLAAAVVCPRQNLKTYILELITLTRLLRPGGDGLAVWSAHEVSTAQETFLRFVELYEAEDETGRPLWPWFRRNVRSISRATGRESITFERRLKSGRKETARLKFKARIKTGGRGLAGDLVILDEAFALEPAHMGSLLPILSTKAKGQIIYGSSAPHATSLILHDVIRRGRAGLMAYVEWAAPGSLASPGCELRGCSHTPGTPGCVLDDIDAAVRCNPAAHHGRISREYLASERQELAAIPQEYARERWGWGEEPAVAGGVPISAEAWAACADPAGQIKGTPVLGLDVSPDRRSAAISLAGRRADAMVQVEVVRHGSGESWVMPEMAKAKAAGISVVGIDGRSQAMAFKADLEAAGWTVLELGPGDQVEACIGLHRDVLAGDRLRHLGDGGSPNGVDVLAQALSVAAPRPVGDGGGWAWARKRSDGDITSLVAMTDARWVLPQVEAQHDQPFFAARR